MLSNPVLEIYKNEELAIEAFKAYRSEKGVICKKCGHEHHYWLPPKRQFQCKNCKFRTTLQSGTILEGSKLPVSYFFIALYLLENNDKNLTVAELQQQTGHKYSEPLYDFLRKVKAYSRDENPNAALLVFSDVASKVHIS